ncbi:hypothetical protein D3C78_865800 [compost metagenome]
MTPEDEKGWKSCGQHADVPDLQAHSWRCGSDAQLFFVRRTKYFRAMAGRAGTSDFHELGESSHR